MGSMSPAEARAELGLALGARAGELAAKIVAQTNRQAWDGPSPSQHYVDHRNARTYYGTLFIGRFLVIGELASEEEKVWIGLGGAMAAA